MSQQLSQLDVNLLIALNVLLEERHVTRAAKRLGVTQSAMSQSLQRLREALDDPLLVRSGGKMIATPRAEAMASPLKAALMAIEQVVMGRPSFDPSTASRRFSFTCLDIYAMNITSNLFGRIAQAGPKLRLDIAPLEVDQIWDQLRRAEPELALVGPWQIPQDISTQVLIQERPVSIARVDHPIFEAPITADRFSQWPHVVFRLTGRGVSALDKDLDQQGLVRRVVGVTPYFLSAPALVSDSDVIVSVPQSLARCFERGWPIRSFDPPLLDPLRYDISMAWPSHLDADPSHQWLRQQVIESAAQLCSGPKRKRA